MPAPIIVPTGITSGSSSSSDLDWSLGTIRTEIRERLGEREPEDFWLNARLNGYVNEAMKRFCTERRWSWLYSSVSGIAVPSGTETLEFTGGVAFNRHFDLLMLREGSTIPDMPSRVSPANGFKLRRMYTTPGFVQWYYVESGELDDGSMALTVKLVPVPNADYTLEYQYVRNPARLEDDTDIPDIPENYVEALVAWATGIAWLKEQNGGPKAQEQFAIYDAVLKSAIADEDGMADDTVVGWGTEEPQWEQGPWTRQQYGLMRMPTNLG